MANLCEAYPCHNDLPKDFNCEFCYCPDYFNECKGNFKFTKDHIKDCSDCTLNHTSDFVNNYYKKDLTIEK